MDTLTIVAIVLALVVGILLGITIETRLLRKDREGVVFVDTAAFEAFVNACTRGRSYVMDTVRTGTVDRAAASKVLEAFRLALGDGNGHAPAHVTEQPVTFF
jgi:hypothetical protein